MYKLSYRNFLGLGIMGCAVWTFWFSWRYKLTTSRCNSECGNKAPNRNYNRKNKQNIIQLFKYIYNRLYGGEVEMYWIIWWKWWSFHLRVGLFYFKYKKQALINIYIYIYKKQATKSTSHSLAHMNDGAISSFTTHYLSSTRRRNWSRIRVISYKL